ncbi:hypothetical protein BOTBODRAFT_37508 [Botryobasidium botryosum FD-172 SS1]|uniref:Epoxide hydrolase N-terminal domain-containing protein n=1 Tax=Botryobasidium botryosum (strain FD-172 SS1) TaxID=930990 RepID=A0A067M0B7_BOTB1|nr:hypothetical protein BOTBODRAFT_37508 [Botryobasidium botryosum FD-172 SS1]
MILPYTMFPLSTSTTTFADPFKVNIPDSAIDEFKTLLRLSKLAPQTYENSQEDWRYGVTGEWMREAKEKWLNDFDWKKREEYINTFPHYTASVVDDNQKEYSIHFIALYSERKDAVPLVLLHGWPGSFLEFLPTLDLLKDKYTPATLPYHVIIPSLPGFTFSSPPPLDQNFGVADVARIFDKLLVGLGFGDGYLVQGGDIGSRVGRVMAQDHASCKAVHVNFCPVPEPSGFDVATVNEAERKGLERAAWFRSVGSAYAITHATRPGTIGFVLASNPLALLAWIGEKFFEWTDDHPPLDTILEAVTLYWLTETFPRAIYTYRHYYAGASPPASAYITKPFGFSWFPKEVIPVPKSWAAAAGNLVFFRQHEKGGHFAALEVPEVLLKDIEEFVEQVWPEAKRQ